MLVRAVWKFPFNPRPNELGMPMTRGTLQTIFRPLLARIKQINRQIPADLCFPQTATLNHPLGARLHLVNHRQLLRLSYKSQQQTRGSCQPKQLKP